MAFRLSDGLVFKMQKYGEWRALSGGYINYFSGTQPASANYAVSGQKIICFKGGTSSQAHVFETRPRWKFTLSSGSSGTVDTVKIDGRDLLGAAVTYASSLTNTASLVAAQINGYLGNRFYSATSSGADVYVVGPYGTGTAMNSAVLTATTTTLSITVAGDGTPSGSGGTAGVASAYGCNFLPPADGSTLTTPYTADSTVVFLGKDATTWTGIAGYDNTNTAITGFSAGTLTAGWGRLVLSYGDDDTLSTGETGYARLDFSIGTSDAYDVVMSPSASFAWGVAQTISTFIYKRNKITA